MTDEPAFADPAGFLRRAASLMREHATAAVSGPWVSHEDERSWSLHVRGWPMQIIKAPKQHPTLAEYWPDEGTGRYITEWHPGVALDVANLLDAIRQGPLPTPNNGVNAMVWVVAMQLARSYMDSVAGRDPED